MRLPYAITGLFVGPVLIALGVLLKGFCAEGSVCVVDPFASIIFLPLVFIYKLFGSSAIIADQEFLFIFIYWSLVGAVLGFILDLYMRPSQYSPGQRLPPSQTSAPGSRPQSRV